MNNPATTNTWFELRQLMEPLVEGFEPIDPQMGIVGVVPVVGGRFIHPLSQESIHRLKIYGAGKDRVKIIEPRFLYSLPLVPISGLVHPAQFCARVAKTLGGILERLKIIRDKAIALGIGLDLEPNVLRLRGRTDLKGILLELVAGDTGKITLVSVGKTALGGLIPEEQRSLELTNADAHDLDALSRLACGLDERLRREALETMERSLGVAKPKQVNSAMPIPEILKSPTSSSQPAATPQTVKKAKPTDQSAETIPLFELPLETPSRDDQVGAGTSPTDMAGRTTEGHRATPGFAPGHTEVLELTELVEADREVMAEPSVKKPSVIEVQGKQDEPMGAVKIKELLDKLGSETELSAQGGKLRLVVPLKVVQGRFVFYLQQSSPTGFKGVMVTPGNVKHPVEFDLKSILDIKEVFDRILLGK